MQAKIAPMPDERKYAGLDIETVEADGTFSGYASLFGKVDLGRDAVERGAFARSLEKRGAAGVRMLFQHDPNQPSAPGRNCAKTHAAFWCGEGWRLVSPGRGRSGS